MDVVSLNDFGGVISGCEATRGLNTPSIAHVVFGKPSYGHVTQDFCP
jgi:hypothetical protein